MLLMLFLAANPELRQRPVDYAVRRRVNDVFFTGAANFQRICRYAQVQTVLEVVLCTRRQRDLFTLLVSRA